MKKRNNPYGYKVGYRENNSRLFNRQFITRTHKQAHHCLLFYRKYGHSGCRKKDIERFNYSIKPITRKEYLAGIWDELPFKRLRLLFRRKLKLSLRIFPFVGLSSHSTNANVNGSSKNYSNFSCSR